VDSLSRSWLRACAVVACLALVSFIAAGTLYHTHKNGQETACQVCQALHLPALAAAALDLVHTPELLGWYVSLPLHDAPLDSLALHRASRAPPA
jgi:hypothetical protein